ncbi:ABA4-like family protein [Sphingomonas sp. LHG3406-1]|uniref:ABA4-like family protein n=1 Tax=Sphingomonas sp. LHG3406-1 TaxID=2804617 RepID=UPI0026191F81|nr:ABA4-like family protein [Sphingomonas sp. LHG3406-1]
MLWDSLFSLTNAVAVVAWALLLFAPRRPLTYSAILYAGVGLLCLAYAAMLVALLSGQVDAGPVAGAGQFDPADYSIEGLRKLFLSDGGLVTGWTHYLAFDLFVGLWIARDADGKGFSRLAQAPILLLTFLAGPLGLLIWLAARERRARVAARR